MNQCLERTRVWGELVAQIDREYAALDGGERAWIAERCAEIAGLQRELDLLFAGGDGPVQCRDCRGDCCDLGHNHLSLANLLRLLQQGDELPRLDFARTCPLLGERGCRLPAESRPYNCISFLCDKIEQRLAPAETARFYRLEQELRGHYQAFAGRYAGGGMSGLLLAARRLQGQPFLRRIDRNQPSS